MSETTTTRQNEVMVFAANSTTTMTTEAMANFTRNHQNPYSLASIVGQTCVLIIILIAAFLGNCLVVGAVCFSRKLRKPAYYFIVSLAVSDVLIAVTIMPFRIHHNLNLMVWNLGPNTCRLWVFMDTFGSSASTANVAMISVDRFLALSYPFRYPQLVNGRRSVITIGLVWTYAIFLSCLSFREWSDDAKFIHDSACTKSDKTYYMFATLLGILFPLVILIVAYSLVFRLAFRQALMIKAHSNINSRQRNGNQGENGKGRGSVQTRILIRELKATKTLMVVVGTFLFCWFPLFILILVLQYCPQCMERGLSRTSQQIMAITFVFILPRLNSALNPVIYSVFNREFRAVLCLMCDKAWNVFPRTNPIRGALPGRSGGLCGPRGTEESTSDNSAAYEPNTDYCGLSSANGTNSRSPSSVFTFKNFDSCYLETSV